MPKIRLTQLAVHRLQPPSEQDRIEYFDTVLPGFGLRVAGSGHRSWTVMYRLPGDPKIRRYTFPFGQYPRVDKARDRAREIMRLVDGGGDPAAKPEARRKGDTVATL